MNSPKLEARRALFKNILAAAPATAVAGIATRARDLGSAERLDAFRRGLDELKRRFDAAERSNKKYLKAAVALAALSLGIDLSALL
jgi:hypothetical protein